MSPNEIRFLRTETQRVARDQLTARHIPQLKLALVETLKAFERFVCDTVGEPCNDIPEETGEALISKFEFLPGRLPRDNELEGGQS